MEKICCIYKIENLNNHKIYIGQTQDFHKRKLSHLSSLRRGKSHNKHLQASFNQHGEDKFEFSVVERCDVSLLDEREMYWINYYDSYNSGYNMDHGGGGIRGYKFTDEQKAKISNANRGRIVSEITKNRMRENHANFKGKLHPSYGVPWKEHVSLEGQEAMRLKTSLRCKGSGNPNFGKKMSDEQRLKLSESHKRYFAEHGNPLKGRKRPEKSGENASCVKKVVCINTGKIYPLIKYAANEHGVSASAISMCCNNKCNSAGYNSNREPLFWMYYDEYKHLSEEDLNIILTYKKSITPNHFTKRIHCITTNEYFNSMRDACNKYHVDPSSLSAHCKKRKCLNGCGKHPDTKELLQWEYVD